MRALTGSTAWPSAFDMQTGDMLMLRLTAALAALLAAPVPSALAAADLAASAGETII